MDSLSVQFDRYRAAHRTLGCRITHMFGIPMIAGSLPIALYDWRIALVVFVMGWILQLVGHRYFERNQPVLASNPTNLTTYFVALLFVTHEWGRLFMGRLPTSEPVTKS